MNPKLQLQDQKVAKKIIFQLLNKKDTNSYKKLKNTITEHPEKSINKYLNLLHKEKWLNREGIRRKYQYSINKKRFEEYFIQQLNTSNTGLTKELWRKLPEKDKKILIYNYRTYIFGDQNTNSWFNYRLFELNNMFVNETLINYEAKRVKLSKKLLLYFIAYKSSLTYDWIFKKPESIKT